MAWRSARRPDYRSGGWQFLKDLAALLAGGVGVIIGLSILGYLVWRIIGGSLPGLR